MKRRIRIALVAAGLVAAPGLIAYTHLNLVSARSYALLVKLKVPESLALGTPLPIRWKFDYLVCTK